MGKLRWLCVLGLPWRRENSNHQALSFEAGKMLYYNRAILACLPLLLLFNGCAVLRLL